jgi:hypothetical protein
MLTSVDYTNIINVMRAMTVDIRDEALLMREKYMPVRDLRQNIQICPFAKSFVCSTGRQ